MRNFEPALIQMMGFSTVHLDEFEPPAEDLEDDEIAVRRAFKRKDEVLKLPPFEQRKLFQRLRNQLFPLGDEAQRRPVRRPKIRGIFWAK